MRETDFPTEPNESSTSRMTSAMNSHSAAGKRPATAQTTQSNGSSPAKPSSGPSVPTLAAGAADDQLRYARQILEMESRALQSVAQRLDLSFCRAVE